MLDVKTVVLRAVRFRDERDVQPQPFEGTIPDLIGVHRHRDLKAGTAAFSVATYAAGATRGKEGVATSTAIVLDYDHLSADAEKSVFSLLAGRGLQRSAEVTR